MANGIQPDFRTAYREAGEILSRRSNRLKLVEGFLFLVTFFIFAFLLREACWQMALVLAVEQWEKVLLSIVGDLLFYGSLFLVVAPLFTGLLHMAVRMANDGDSFLIDLFYSFSSGKRYLRSLIVLFPLYWKFAVFCWFPGILYDAFAVIFGNAVVFVVVGNVVLWILNVIWLLLALRGFVRLSFLLQWRMPLLAACRANRQIAGRSFSGGGRWWLCFLPRILLGFLTVGILLVADVIPRMLISYFRYAGRMTEYPFPLED
ncbi:MAG: hypothetical protein E7680_00545 [Ruminococcaceae bacterium]|nr:hypothetical protein [Oscillospiraceae bacterium]